MDMRDTLGVLLAGGAGERLFPLTRDRAKPAVPFGGHYRIIDITLSNCINSGLRRSSSSPNTKPSRSTVTSAKAGPALSPRSWANSLSSCRPCSAPAPTGTWAPPTPSIRTSTPSAASSRNTSSSFPATTSTKWITAACSSTTRTPRLKSPSPRCPSLPTKSRASVWSRSARKAKFSASRRSLPPPASAPLQSQRRRCLHGHLHLQY